MATETIRSNVFHTDYEDGCARSDNLHPLTTDTDKLLYHLIRMSKGISYRDADSRDSTLTSLLENHVLTVLTDIRRKNLSGYGNSFAEAQGTEEQAYYVRKLERDVERWVARLEAYLQAAFVQGRADSPTVQIASKLHEELDNTLRTEDEHNHRYYRMLHTVTAIHKNADSYLRQAADGGDTEPALALLIAYLKNYAGIAEVFNRRLASLPELYRKEVLHARPAEAVPDNTYLVITPAPSGSPIRGRGGFTLAEETAFAAGDDLIYKTTQDEYISPMRCVQADAISLPNPSRGGACIQTLHSDDASNAEALFTGGEALRTGWQIESPMLILEEGRRDVTVSLRLKGGNTPTDTGKKQGFVLEYSTADGWEPIHAECGLTSDELRFGFTIGRDGIAPSPCTEETHGIVTAYPALRILTDKGNYPTWAEGLEFESVSIETSVSGIRSFTLINELGETDTTQTVSPFGIQAERGAWFRIGLEEAGMKPLKELMLTGKWQKLPETKNGLDQLYKDYPGVDASSFRIRTDYRKNDKWESCEEDSPLFTFDHTGRLQDANITFRPKDNSDNLTASKDRLFRVTLASPSIGFGTAAYRNLFTEVMVHNSRCKEKDMRTLPQEPPIPLLADMELSYKAENTVPIQSPSITPITLTEGTKAPPREGLGRLLPQSPSPYTLYFAFADAVGERKIRMYLDLALDKPELPYCCLRSDSNAVLVWSYWNSKEWTDIPSKDITAEETAALTRSGFIEITLEERIDKKWTDKNGLLWLRAAFMQGGNPEKPVKEKPSTLAVRGIWTNCIRVTADGGDGTPLPAGTIQGTAEEDTRIGSVIQPLPGFGGRQAETEAQCASRQTARIHNRHRAVTLQDYTDILTEHFPELVKVRCFNIRRENGTRKTVITVFSRAEDGTYFLSPTWKLAEMERTLRQYTPPFARVEVINPVYEQTVVHIKARLHEDTDDEDKVIRQLVVLAQNYLAPWKRKGDIPEPGQTYSPLALHSRLVNHEDVEELLELTVNGKDILPKEDKDGENEDGDKERPIRGTYPWSILLPKVEIGLLPYRSGIEEAEIGGNFTIN
ncbi:baseplate J/gp47 family protein [Bacteroides sp. An19]|uniref:baseplate J/gp47 family protein n=1 Tax=Bacteroides sp. An19 TaxID=1965580 RepID=UPI000B378A36|nr:baseplate J/gp47 family protein [Bacteroides sp. An19]OUP30522.1 hypothetical protein B5F25_14535 [Bacteroides sp. An19]